MGELPDDVHLGRPLEEDGPPQAARQHGERLLLRVVRLPLAEQLWAAVDRPSEASADAACAGGRGEHRWEAHRAVAALRLQLAVLAESQEEVWWYCMGRFQLVGLVEDGLQSERCR